jgi:hypothetical protein
MNTPSALHAPASIPFDERVLNAIGAVEDPDHRFAVGAHGERGHWQMKEATWKQYTKLPFDEWADDDEAGRLVALAHLQWLTLELLRAGIEPTPYNLAVAWNAGLTPLVEETYTESTEEYANRVALLFRHGAS